MIASIIIEYSVKSLNKTFDYLVPPKILNTLKVGHKVKVPFGNTLVEGIVLNLHKNIEKDVKYKEIIEIVDEEFYLNEELLKLGKTLEKQTFSNLISCYQIMLPKALKASEKTNIKKQYKTYIKLASVDYKKYIHENKRNKKEIEIIEHLESEHEVEKCLLSCSSLKSLINKGIVLEVKTETNREVSYNKEEKRNVILTNIQKETYEKILVSKNKNILLRGVTGCGKTEIYIKLIENCLKEGKTAILLVPEISLTPQIISRFKSEFTSSVAVLHSRLSDGEKYDEYRKIMRGEVDIVIGARSAVFAPLKNIGIIIVDECSSPSYKQENTPKYNAIDVALERCKYHNAICLLGSASPLLEQYARAEKGIFNLIELDKRVNNNLPTIELVDMSNEIKKRNFILSEKLKNKITEKLNKNEQVILLLNRRGYSTFISCSSCGYVYKCPNCDISLIYHKTNNNLRCHYCGYSTKKSDICPSCKEEALKDLGLGTEKLESIIIKTFPSAKVLRMDLDTTSKKGSYERIIDSFKNGEYDILVGTQMISKGLNFPKVTLVGIINADSSLSIPDFRSGERTFDLLMQTSGRSGRHNIPGEVLIQTYNTDNYVLKHVKKHDYVSFYKEEMEIRKQLKYPPYFYIIRLKITSLDYEKAKNTSMLTKKYLDNNLSNNFIVLGPSTCSVFKLKNKYNFNIIIKYKKEENIFEVLKEINENNIKKDVTIDIDINPLNLL